ncbi:protein translocase subunit SecD [Sesbania bispinosa]|nr:protein translocase subunit SecD [Sesbania bispinosa]
MGATNCGLHNKRSANWSGYGSELERRPKRKAERRPERNRCWSGSTGVGACGAARARSGAWEGI